MTDQNSGTGLRHGQFSLLKIISATGLSVLQNYLIRMLYVVRDTPLILDGLGCVSDSQFIAINTFLSKGGKIWLGLPFGTHDEKGYKRGVPLSVNLLKRRNNNIIIRKELSIHEFIKDLLLKNKFHPVLKQISGDTRWAARLRMYKVRSAIHFLNRALIAVPHPTLKDIPGNAILKDIESDIKDNHLVFKINTGKLNLMNPSVWSPELGNEPRQAEIRDSGKGFSTIDINLDGIKIYAVIQ